MGQMIATCPVANALLLNQRRVTGRGKLPFTTLHISRVLSICLTGALPAGRRLLMNTLHPGIFDVFINMSFFARHRSLRPFCRIGVATGLFFALAASAAEPKRYDCPRAASAI